MAYFNIIIPVYNKVGMMDSCIASIREQTFEDFEVLLVNDGSTDDSLAMIQDFSKQDPRFKVLSYEKNQSVLAARLFGMKAAAKAGSNVLFIDSDDEIEKTLLQEVHDVFEETGADLIRFGLKLLPGDREWEPEETDDLLQALFYNGMPPAVWKNAYSGELIRKADELIESFYCNMGEDSYMSTVFFALAKKDVTLKRPLYRYMIGNGMSTTALSIPKMKKVLDSLSVSGSHILSFIEKNKPEYMEGARHFVDAMYRHQLIQNVVTENDWTMIVRLIALFDREECQSIFEFGCKELLKIKMKYDGQEFPAEEWDRLETL